MSIFFQPRGPADITMPERAQQQLEARINYESQVRERTIDQLDPLLSEPSWYSGAFVSGFGRMATGAAYKLGLDIFDNDGTYQIPLNFDPKEKPDENEFGYSGPMGTAFDSDFVYGRNNLEGLLEMTDDIPNEDRRFILNAPNWGEFQDRLTMYRSKDPAVVEEMAVNYGGTAPIWADLGTDAAALVGTAMITEPLMWLGTGARFAKAGTATAQAAAAGSGGNQVAAAAALAQSLAKTAPVISLAERSGRAAALGLIDQALYTGARYGLDDFYRPDNQQLLFEFTAAIGMGGAVGAALSKRMANDLMRGYAESAFSTLPITPVTAATIPTPPSGVAISGVISSAIPAGPSLISGVQAEALVGYLRQIGVNPEEFFAALKTDGVIDSTARQFGDITNDPRVLGEINSRIMNESITSGNAGLPVFLEAGGNIGDAGVDVVTRRAEEVIDKILAKPADETADAVGVFQKTKEEATKATVDRLIDDMKADGYRVRKLSDIPNDPDTLAKLDAWFDDIADGYNSPFGFRRNTQASTQPIQTGNVKFAQPPAAAPVSAGSQNVPATTVSANVPTTAAPTAQRITPHNLGSASPLPGVVPTTSNPMQGLDAAVPINNIRIPWLNRFLNQAALLLEKDKNPLARHFAYRAFFARRVLLNPETNQPVPQPRTVVEELRNVLDMVLARQIRIHDAHFQRFALGVGLNDKVSLTRTSISRAFGKGKTAAKAEFDNRVWAVITSGAPDVDPTVNAFAKDMRQMMDEVAEYANQAGVPGFEKHRMLQNYFPRLYNFEGIQTLTATAPGRSAFTKLLAAALETSPGSRQLRVFDSSTGTYRILNFTDIDLAAEAFGNRLMELAVGGEGAPFLDLDQAIIDAIENMQGPLKEASSSPSPRGRTRILLNENVEIDAGFDVFGTGTTKLRFGDLVNRDLVNASKKYATSVLGATAERRLLNIIEEDLWQLGFRESAVAGPGSVRLKFENVDEWVGFANREGQVRGKGPLTPLESNAIERIRATLKFEPRVDSRALGNAKIRRYMDITDNYLNAGLSVVKGYTYLMFAGLFGAAAAAETGRLTGTFGAIKVIRELPLAVNMLREWDDLTPQQQGLTAMLDQFGIMTDRLRRTVFSTPQAEIQFSKRGRFRQGLGTASNVYADVTLLAPITSFTQGLTGLTMLQHLMEMSRGQVKRLDDSTIFSLGLTVEQYEKAGRFLDANAVTKKSVGRNAIIDIKNINDPDFVYVRSAVDRMVKTRIQDVSTIADTSSYADYAFSSLLTQFKNYNLKAIDNLLLQNYSRFYNTRGTRAKTAAGAKVAAEIAASFLVAGLIKQAITVVQAKNAKDAGDLETYYKLRENIGLKGFAKQGLLGPGELWLPVMATEAAWSRFDEEPLLSQFRYSGSDMVGFPAGEALKNISSAATDIGGEIMYRFDPDNPNTRFITRNTTNNIFKSIPLQNYPPVSRYFDQLEQYINDEYDLPYEQPRR